MAPVGGDPRRTALAQAGLAIQVLNHAINELFRGADALEALLPARPVGEDLKIALTGTYLANKLREAAGRLSDRKFYQGVGQRVSVAAVVRTQEDLPDWAAFPPEVQAALEGALDALLAQGVDPGALTGPIDMGTADRVDDDHREDLDGAS